MPAYILAVDQGTSSTKAIVFSDTGEPVATASAPLHTIYTPDGKAEQDPHGIYRSAVTAVDSCLHKLEEGCGISRNAVACAGISNQRETFILWDVEGTPLHNAVVWQCKRSISICEELNDAGAEKIVRERSGLIVDPYFSGTKILWLLRNDNSVKNAYESGKIQFGTVDTWLLYRLTQGKVLATDHSNASRTLLFNIHTLDWDATLTGLLDMPKLGLPEVYPSSHRYGETDFQGLFRHPIPITAMIGDSQAAFFGERCFEVGSAKATLGTGTSILLNTGDDPPALSPSAMSTVGYSLSGRCTYALEGIVVSAGSLLTWLQRALGLYSDPSVLETMALDAGDSGGVCFVPGHAGLGAPYWKMDARGGITGLTFGTDKRHIVRAALECIPYQIRAILDAVREETGIGCNSLRIDGGISRNTFVLHWAADTLQVPVYTSGTVDVTALGTAFLAGLGAGIYQGIDEIAALPLPETTIEPGRGVESADAGYRKWRTAIERTIAV